MLPRPAACLCLLDQCLTIEQHKILKYIFGGFFTNPRKILNTAEGFVRPCREKDSKNFTLMWQVFRSLSLIRKSLFDGSIILVGSYKGLKKIFCRKKRKQDRFYMQARFMFAMLWK